LRVLSWLHQRAGSLGPYSSAETPAASGIGEDSGWGSGTAPIFPSPHLRMNTRFLCHLNSIVIVNLIIGSDGSVARVGPTTPTHPRTLAILVRAIPFWLDPYLPAHIGSIPALCSNGS
jgi:hypothetical protein